MVAGSARDDVVAAVATGESTAALHALGAVFRWAAETLQAAVKAVDSDSASAFRAVVALDAAMAAAGDLLAMLPEFLAVADAGAPTEHDLKRWADQQERAAADVGTLRAELERRRARAQELDDVTREHDALRARIDELQHAERLTGLLDGLRTTHRDLTERVDVFAQQTIDIERALELTGRDLHRLTDEQTRRLRDAVRQVLIDAATAQREWAEQVLAHRAALAQAELERDTRVGELTQAQVRLAELTTEHAELHAALNAHASANRVVSAGIDRLREVEELLRQADERLAAELAERERRLRESRSARFLGDAATGGEAGSQD